MRTRTAAWLSWSIWLVALAFDLATLVLQTANDPTRLLVNIFGALVLGTFATVGALIAMHRLENRIGWLLSVSSLVWVIGDTMLEYGVYALLTKPGSLPFGVWMAWYGFGIRGVVFAVLVTFLPLIFPDGRLPSRRWRWAAWLAASSVVLFSVTALLGSSSTEDRLPFLRNPLGVALPSNITNLLDAIYIPLAVAAEAACGAAAIGRFRRASGDERQQLKWFAYAAILGFIVFLGIIMIVFGLPGFADDQGRVSSFLFNLLIAGFPIAVGMAILKYRLYDIDIIINRTLVYGALTAFLALVYIGCIVLLRQFLSPLTGSSDLAIVVSTLAIAALFSPLRRRIQNLIDRRFYRRKYDATKVLASFATTARDETDLERLTAEIVSVVDDTMQPEFVGLWLREPRREA